MLFVVAQRTNRPTYWARGAWKPEGRGKLGPISWLSVLTLTPLRRALAGLILDQIRHGRMILIYRSVLQPRLAGFSGNAKARRPDRSLAELYLT